MASTASSDTRLPTQAPQLAGKKRTADEMTSSSPTLTALPIERAARIIELVADADVTLQTGSGESALDIRVSSYVLSLSSKMFAKMLNSSFVEGTTKVVELLDDDPFVVLHYCQIIHHQTNAISGVDGDRLRALTTLADMRSCEEALKPWMMLAIEEYRAWSKTVTKDPSSMHKFPDSIPNLTVEDVITIAYVFDILDLFWETTMAYLTQSAFCTPALSSDTKNDYTPIPTGDGCFFGKRHIPFQCCSPLLPPP